MGRSGKQFPDHRYFLCHGAFERAYGLVADHRLKFGWEYHGVLRE